VADHAYSDESLAKLYDVLNPWGPSDDFYLDLVMFATAVLDVGCGTGSLLRGARKTGHDGRLCGLDPARAMLDQARGRRDIEWVLGDLADVGWDQEFDLVVMTGHAFQVLVDDEELRTSLAAIRTALTGGGRFAFETRNPLTRPWERWTPDNAVDVTDETGAVVRVEHQLKTPVDGEVVRFSETFSSPGWERPQVSWSSLRFLAPDSLAVFLAEAGLVVEEQFGDWARSPLTAGSPEIITIARRAGIRRRIPG
jgi:SAM-dependent methyltransferase